MHVCTVCMHFIYLGLCFYYLCILLIHVELYLKYDEDAKQKATLVFSALWMQKDLSYNRIKAWKWMLIFDRIWFQVGDE